MRLLGITFQFFAIILAFCTLSSILPQCFSNTFAWIANFFLSCSAALWIIELYQGCFFTAEIDKVNKAVLVTGCDTGFGQAFAKILHDKGFHVYACCYDKESEGADRLRDTCSARLKIVQLDVTKDDSVAEALKFVQNNLENTELWAIVNNAGVLRGFHSELSSMQDYEDCIQVNVLGVIRVTKAFLPLIRHSKGRVINVTSRSGRGSCPLLGPYATSKWAVVAFTEVLKLEMREFGIRVISIEPEFFKTPLTSEANLQNVYEQSLSHVAEDVKSAYGTKYIQKAKELHSSIILSSCENINLVIDAVISAVALQNPADVYQPCRDIFITIFLMAAERVPAFLAELFLMFFQYFMGLPPPKTGINVFSRLLKM